MNLALGNARNIYFMGSKEVVGTAEAVMNPLATLGLGMGSAWLSGFNLYATVLTLGLLQRFHLVQLPGDLDFLSRWWVIGVAAVLYLVEFLADKIPVVDSVSGTQS